MLRLILLLGVIAVAALWIEPRWLEENRTLALRVRENGEIIYLLKRQAIELGQSALDAAVESGGPPPVSTGPPDELLDEGDDAERRMRVRELVREKAQGYEHDSRARAD